MNRVMLSKSEAQTLVEAHEVEQLLGNVEEVELLGENNPDLLNAYRRLVKIAEGQ